METDPFPEKLLVEKVRYIIIVTILTKYAHSHNRTLFNALTINFRELLHVSGLTGPSSGSAVMKTIAKVCCLLQYTALW
jgi:hypothetical protein